MQNGKYEIKLMNKIASVGTDRLDPAQFGQHRTPGRHSGSLRRLAEHGIQ